MKTPALDFLAKNKVDFKQYTYESADPATHDFGRHAAHALNLPEEKVFKTIILHHDKTYVTCIVPVTGRISLKAAARATKLKDLETVDPATAQRVTGYVVGGISPFGQKKRMITVLDSSALNQEEILVSAGMRGMSVGLKPQDIVDLLQATVADVMEK
ncbi:MAG: Cys-tRNA(Pro) deacylase [Candidatus Anaerobiospirillum pullicola]|uniref:Cys-tRNA(Pro)/Cys-tRNA(Cys) deacylase n=1 Tax=Candidatus Anaerobiospirillum pullicola TaxID=2838451 RepID=A0A948THY3_9GAMM|nr:Cys-tRNA(Pro) deacylase [Candidatus Anaerobiospirillum pullicola]